MNNLLAFQFLCECQFHGARSITDVSLSTYGLESYQFNYFRLQVTKPRETEIDLERTLTLIVGATCHYVPYPKDKSTVRKALI